MSDYTETLTTIALHVGWWETGHSTAEEAIEAIRSEIDEVERDEATAEVVRQLKAA